MIAKHETSCAQTLIFDCCLCHSSLGSAIKVSMNLWIIYQAHIYFTKTLDIPEFTGDKDN